MQQQETLQENVVELYRSGWDINLIAEEFNITEPDVVNEIMSYKEYHSTRGKSGVVGRIKRKFQYVIVDRLNSGASVDEIMSTTGVSSSTIHRIKKEADIQTDKINAEERMYTEIDWDDWETCPTCKSDNVRDVTSSSLDDEENDSKRVAAKEALCMNCGTSWGMHKLRNEKSYKIRKINWEYFC